MDNMSTAAGHDGTVCNCPHHKFMPILVVAFGVVFLLGYLDVFSMGTVNIIWPIIVIVGGLTRLMESKCKCC